MVPRINGIILVKFYRLLNFIMEVLDVFFEKYTKILYMLRTSSMSKGKLFCGNYVVFVTNSGICNTDIFFL